MTITPRQMFERLLDDEARVTNPMGGTLIVDALVRIIRRLDLICECLVRATERDTLR
jgi:hypothetical protein